MSSSFTLHRLPSVVLTEVFKQLEVNDVINFSLTSIKFAGRIQWITKKVPIRVFVNPLLPHNHILLSDPLRGHDAVEHQWKNVEDLDFFARNFAIEFIDFLLGSDPAISVSVLEHAKSLGLTFGSVCWRKNCDSKIAAKVLKICSSARFLDFQCSALQNLDGVDFHEFHMDSLSISNAEWVTLDQICAMENIREKIRIVSTAKLTNASFNSFVRKWIACELQFKEAVIWVNPDIELNMEKIMDGVHFLERPSEECYVVQRADGTIGTIILETISQFSHLLYLEYLDV